MKLEIVHSNGKREIFHTDKRRVTVGRGSSADLRILEKYLSREHICIEVAHGKYFVTDLGSSNGTILGEDDLVANEKTEFTSYFPINIGPIAISLLPEDALTTFMSEKDGIKNQAMEDSHGAGTGTDSHSTGPQASNLMQSMGRNISDENGDEQSRRPGPPPKRNSISEREQKKSYLIIIAILIGGYLYYTNVHQIKTEFKKRQKEKHTIKGTPLDQIVEKEKCVGKSLEKMCKNIFRNMKFHEGIVLEGKNLYIITSINGIKQNKTLKKRNKNVAAKTKAMKNFFLVPFWTKYLRPQFKASKIEQIQLITFYDISLIDSTRKIAPSYPYDFVVHSSTKIKPEQLKSLNPKLIQIELGKSKRGNATNYIRKKIFSQLKEHSIFNEI